MAKLGPIVSQSIIQLTASNLHKVVVPIDPVDVSVGWELTALLIDDVVWGTSVEPDGL